VTESGQSGLASYFVEVFAVRFRHYCGRIVAKTGNWDRSYSRILSDSEAMGLRGT